MGGVDKMKSVKLFVAGSALAMSLALAPTVAADPQFEVAPVTQGALPGDLIHNPMAIKWNPEGGNKSVSIVESEGVPGSQAISFRVRKKSNKPWDIRMRAPFDKSISAGEEIEVYFWARAAKPARRSETGKISVAIGRDVEPYDTVLNAEILPTEEWKMYRVSGVAERDFPTSESEMGFNFGFVKQTIELGPFYAISKGMPSE
jgi:hypothetical protein